MNPDQFTQNEEVQEAIEKLKKNLGDRKEWRVSDVVDADGRQYVDIVMEGGGVLGIALLGYIYALEQVGIRFMSIGGTSAGAVTALLLAAAGPKNQSKSKQLISVLASQKLNQFVDGDADARDFVHTLLKRRGGLKLAFKAAQVIDNLTQDLGLNPGDAFTEWIEGLLNGWGIHTSEDLLKRMETMPEGLKHAENVSLEGKPEARLALVAAEVTTETKVEFPRMTSLFWKKPEKVNPALYVRASMSIPFFFHPLRVSAIPKDKGAPTRWKDLAGYTGTLPDECMFIDGGIMSNFPIDVFHKPHQVPKMPTFGVKLGADRSRPHKIEGPGKLAEAIFNAARHTLDYDFIMRNRDYRHLVAHIDTKGHDWLDFNLSDVAKVDLFLRGVLAAVQFLGGGPGGPGGPPGSDGFDWKGYKKIRRDLCAGQHKTAAGEEGDDVPIEAEERRQAVDTEDV